MFIATGNERPVNLDNVTTIFIDNIDKKIIFNFNYSIRVSSRDKLENQRADYIAWYLSEEDLERVKISLLEMLSTTEWFLPDFKHNHRCVKKSMVSTIKFADYINRIIFNLTCSVTDQRSTSDSLTSDFVFWNFEKDPLSYSKACQELESNIISL